MTTPSDASSDGQPDSPTRLRFRQRLEALPIKPATHEQHLRDLAGGAGEVHMPESLLSD